jgi:hypothetical protein
MLPATIAASMMAGKRSANGAMRKPGDSTKSVSAIAAATQINAKT